MGYRLLVIGVALAALVGCQESAQERCAREVVEYTAKNCPARVSDNITLDSLNYSETENCIGYFYTVSGLMDSLQLMQEKQNELQELMKKEIRNSTNLKFYKEVGVSFKYVYFSSRHPKQELLRCTYTEKDYR